MKHGSLFSGIGGFDLAAEWMRWENAFHCEWNEFGKRVLKHYWPNAKSYEDITKTDFSFWRGRIDVLSGGFPCQPYSQAGKRLGKEDERHLWPEMLRAIREIQPRWVVGENVRGLVNWSKGLVFDEVQADLEREGYEVQPFLLPASGVGAPHQRERIWFVAYTDSNGQQRSDSKHEVEPGQGGINAQRNIGEVGWNAYDANGASKSRQHKPRKRQGKFDRSNSGNNTSRTWQNFPTQSPICGRNDGLPTELDGITFSKWRNESIKAYGNAIVPQVAYQIFQSINQYENR